MHKRTHAQRHPHTHALGSFVLRVFALADYPEKRGKEAEGKSVKSIECAAVIYAARTAMFLLLLLFISLLFTP